MRSRNIKPGYFKNEELAACAPLTRILFAGLWCMADRDGRTKDRPKRIKADVLPYDDCDCDAMLGELVAHGFIERYESEGQAVIQVNNFVTHQRPHPKEPSESLPAKPCTNPARTRKKISVPGEYLASCALPSFPSESTSLTPSPVAQPRRAGRKTPPAGFDEFWSAYPRKVGKGDAQKAWAALPPDGDLLGKILTAVKWQAGREEWTRDGGRYVPHPATWLRAERWLDERATPPPGEDEYGEVESGPVSVEYARKLLGDAL
jgi:hypothetical protein